MFIISGARQLSQAIFTLDVSVRHDQFGRDIPESRTNVAFLSVDATGSINPDDIIEACASMVQSASNYMGCDMGYGWHDVL